MFVLSLISLSEALQHLHERGNAMQLNLTGELVFKMATEEEASATSGIEAAPTPCTASATLEKLGGNGAAANFRATVNNPRLPSSSQGKVMKHLCDQTRTKTLSCAELTDTDQIFQRLQTLKETLQRRREMSLELSLCFATAASVSSHFGTIAN